MSQATIQRLRREFLNDWVSDRAENDEQLFIGEYRSFANERGYTYAEIDEALTKEVKEQARKKHKALRKKWNTGTIFD